jgi:hypothetical protein
VVKHCGNAASLCQVIPALNQLDIGTLRKYNLTEVMLSEEDAQPVVCSPMWISLMKEPSPPRHHSDDAWSSSRFRRSDWSLFAVKDRLSITAAIVTNPGLESGLLKVATAKKLTRAEVDECSAFKLPTSQTVEVDADELLSSAFKKQKLGHSAGWLHTCLSTGSHLHPE